MTASPSSSSAHAERLRRQALGTARALSIYGLLLGGSVVFSLPFVWMVGTSFKVDREMFSSQIRLFPGRPVPTPASPYLDPRYVPPPTDALYGRVQPVLRKLLAETFPPIPPEVHNRGQAEDILLPALHQRLLKIIPEAIWALDGDALAEGLRPRMTGELIDTVVRQVYRGLSLSSVRVRSFDLQEKELTGETPVKDFWRLESDVPAQFAQLPRQSSSQTTLVYDFRDVPDGEIRLSRTLALPFRADRLFRIQLGITPDDTWHPLRFIIEHSGKRFLTSRPRFLGNTDAMVVTLQEYGPDDAPDSNRIKLWIPYRLDREDSSFESDPHQVKVTMVLRRNSALGAWWAKCWRNYREVLDYIPFWRYASTSALLVILNIIGNIFSCSLVAYAFARLHWPGRDFCFGLMLATLMIPPQVTMIPFFLIMKSLGWYNTLTPLWFISFFGNAFNIFLLRQFMKGIPRDLEDAARIDGCNFLQIYWYVMMPLIKPTLACIAIFTFMAVWNDFMGPLIFLSDQRLYPLSLGLYALNVQSLGNFGMMMAGSFLMTLPVILIFFFAQKYFIQGIALTGTKG